MSEPTTISLEKDTAALSIRMNGKVLLTTNCPEALDVAWGDRYTFIGRASSRQFSPREIKLAQSLHNEAQHSFAQGFAEGLRGETRPIDELWDGIL